jgi:hypothetical protein
MKEILFNVALIDLTNYCTANNIDCSGSHLYKYPRRFTYALLKDETNKAIITVTFYKNRTPSRIIHK